MLVRSVDKEMQSKPAGLKDVDHSAAFRKGAEEVVGIVSIPKSVRDELMACTVTSSM